MKMFKALTASVVMAAAIMGASASQASTLVSNLNLDGTGGDLWPASAPFGQVSVNDAGGKLAFTVTLLDGLKFQRDDDASFTFNLGNLSGISVSNISDNGAGSFSFENNPGTQSPFGSFKLGVDCSSNCSSSYSSSAPSVLTFTVSGASALTVDDLTKNSSGNYFSANVTSYFGDGNVGANGVSITRTSTPGAVPEPASWAIMLMGFGGLGAMLRQRRQGMALVRA